MEKINHDVIESTRESRKERESTRESRKERATGRVGNRERERERGGEREREREGETKGIFPFVGWWWAGTTQLDTFQQLLHGLLNVDSHAGLRPWESNVCGCCCSPFLSVSSPDLEDKVAVIGKGIVPTGTRCEGMSAIVSHMQ